MEEEIKFKCEKCNYETKNKHSYNKHIETILHITGEKKIRSDKKNNKCDECNNEYSSQRALKEHKLNKHSNKKEKKVEYKYYCEICNVGKNNKLVYEKHIKSDRHEQMIKS